MRDVRPMSIESEGPARRFVALHIATNRSLRECTLSIIAFDILNATQWSDVQLQFRFLVYHKVKDNFLLDHVPMTSLQMLYTCQGIH
jgi:hypothetical protein